MFYNFYKVYRNSLPLDDTSYLKKILEESIVIQNNLLTYFSKFGNDKNNKSYNQILKSSRTNYRLLQVIYSNLFGEDYMLNSKLKNYRDKESVILDIINLSEKLRKLLYGLNSQTHKYMLFDVITNNINVIFLFIFVKLIKKFLDIYKICAIIIIEF